MKWALRDSETTFSCTVYRAQFSGGLGFFQKPHLGVEKWLRKKPDFGGFLTAVQNTGYFFKKWFKILFFGLEQLLILLWDGSAPKNRFLEAFGVIQVTSMFPLKNGQILVFGFFDPLNAVFGQKQGRHWTRLEKLLKIGPFQVSQGICWATMRFQKRR